MHQLFKTSLWILCLVAAASADVIVVDAVGGAGADFTALQPAIDAAADGDILLVRDGLYEPFSIAGKGLVITADAGATIRLDPGSLTVSGVPAGSAVSLTGLESDAFMFAGQLVHSSVTLGLTSNVGPVSLRDCEFSANVATGAAFIIDDGTRVVMSDCSLFGLTLLNGTPEAALLVEDAELYASRCSITGLVGHPATSWAVCRAGRGAPVSSSGTAWWSWTSATSRAVGAARPTCSSVARTAGTVAPGWWSRARPPTACCATRP